MGDRRFHKVQWRAAKARRPERDQYFVFFNISTDLMCIADPHGCFKKINPACSQTLGYAEEDLLAKPFIEFVHPDDRQNTQDEMARQVQRGFSLKFENRYRCKDGSFRWLSWTANYDKNDGLTYATARDVTERKDAEDTLRASEENLATREREFRTLAENSPDNIARYDCNAHTLYVNPAFAHTLGLTPASLMGKTPLEAVPGKLFAAYQRALLRVGATGESAGIEQIIPVEGERPRVHSFSIVAEKGQDGVPIDVLAVGRDISTMKWAEENLRITASVFSSSQEGIAITDADRNITDVNPAFTKITGYSREEVIGRNPSMLSSGRHDKAFYAAMWETLAREKSWRGEIWDRRKSGEVFAELLSITAICDNDGTVQRYVGVFSDINYLKTHEAELNQFANYDVLTGVPNRRLLVDRMAQAIARAKRVGKMLSVCMLDLDGFKQVNDQYGHEAGDQLLLEVSRRLQGVLRAEDTLARLGGDEFVMLFNDLDSVAECQQILDRIVDIIAIPITIDGHVLTISASIGVAYYSAGVEGADTLLRHADHAMYVAKHSGKGCYRLYDPKP